MQRDRYHVETRPSGAQFHRHLGALLLLRDSVSEPTLMPVEFLEFLLLRLQHVGRGMFGEIDLELASLGLLPVEALWALARSMMAGRPRPRPDAVNK